MTLALATTAACDHHSAAKDPPPMSAPSLTLTARSESAGAPLRLVLTLTNGGSGPVWINRRMSVGYPDDLLREVYLIVHDERGAVVNVPDAERVDAHRSSPARTDFAELAPGASVATTTDVTPWFPTRRAGRYQVTVTYVNDDGGAAFGLHAFTGAVTAAPFELTIAPP
jgi:hypothetical protein